MVYIKHNIILPLFCFYIFPISYAEVHNLTNPKIAWSDMKNCENLYCMHSKDVHFISVDLPLKDEKSKHAYHISKMNKVLA
jgi:hypothetical protein